MTNGEMIKAIFPSAEIDIGNGGNDIWIAIDCWTIFKKEWWDAEYKEPTTKNDLGVDAISRAEVLKLMQDNWHTHNGDWAMQESMDDIRALSSVTPQELFKPMVEIDLDYVIKQKYIEREVLDKIRAEIETKYGRCKLTEYIVQYDGICTGANDIGDIADILQIIDKYKAEGSKEA